MTFRQLLNLNPRLPPGQQQQRAVEEFPSVVRQSHMELWQPGQDLINGDHGVWIAIATYSVLDLELLDALEAKLSCEEQKQSIYVFDVFAFPEFGDFEKYLPGIGKVFQTPIIGAWTDGILEEKLWGAEARQWLVRRYELSL